MAFSESFPHLVPDSFWLSAKMLRERAQFPAGCDRSVPVSGGVVYVSSKK
jgi:hypothetical protein